MANPKIVKGCLIAAIVAGVLAVSTLVISFVCCGLAGSGANHASGEINNTINTINSVLTEANATRAESVLKENMSASSQAPEVIAHKTIEQLNNSGTEKNQIDEAYPAFGTEPAPGVTVILFDNNSNSYTINAYDENVTSIKTITIPSK